MKDFLPYKSYRLLDTQWIIGGTSGAGRHAASRPRRAGVRAGAARLADVAARHGGVSTATGISVRFVLRDVDASWRRVEQAGRRPQPNRGRKAERGSREINRELFQLERSVTTCSLQVTTRPAAGRSRHGGSGRRQAARDAARRSYRRITILKQALSDADARKPAGRPVIDTSFRMDDGETVVVGTSRVKGGSKALIALLTADERSAEGDRRSSRGYNQRVRDARDRRAPQRPRGAARGSRKKAARPRRRTTPASWRSWKRSIRTPTPS